MTEMLPVHPLAELWPMLPAEELEVLADDIKTHGLIHPIVLDVDGRILDGRNRYRACWLADVEPMYETYDGDAAMYIISANKMRRHLSTGQCAMVTAQMLVADGKRKDGRWLRGSVTGGDNVKSTLSPRAWQQAMRQAGTIMDQRPDLAPMVVDGTLAISNAHAMARQKELESAGPLPHEPVDTSAIPAPYPVPEPAPAPIPVPTPAPTPTARTMTAEEIEADRAWREGRYHPSMEAAFATFQLPPRRPDEDSRIRAIRERILKKEEDEHLKTVLAQKRIQDERDLKTRTKKRREAEEMAAWRAEHTTGSCAVTGMSGPAPAPTEPHNGAVIPAAQPAPAPAPVTVTEIHTVQTDVRGGFSYAGEDMDADGTIPTKFEIDRMLTTLTGEQMLVWRSHSYRLMERVLDGEVTEP